MSYIGPWYGPVNPRPVELTEDEQRELREEKAAIEREAARLRALYDELEGPEDDGQEPDRAAEYERMRRERLEGEQGGEANT